MEERSFNRWLVAYMYDDIIEDLIDWAIKCEYSGQLLWDLLDEKLLRNEIY